MREKEDGNDIGITEEELRQFKVFENVSTERARAIIETVKQFSIIAYEYYIHVKRGEEKDDEKEKSIVNKMDAKKVKKRKRSIKFNKEISK